VELAVGERRDGKPGNRAGRGHQRPPHAIKQSNGAAVPASNETIIKSEQRLAAGMGHLN
jgi:hypothetical protein